MMKLNVFLKFWFLVWFGLVWFSLVRFYGTSIIVCYQYPFHFYTYKQFYFKQISLV